MKGKKNKLDYTETYLKNILDIKNVKKYEQFYTPKNVADYMSKMFFLNDKKILTY